ncbi:MAG: DUF4041 domain-containing protein [Bacillota bacterium]
MGKWYLQTWFICLMFALWLFIVPPIIGIVLLVVQFKEIKKLKSKVAMIDDANAESNRILDEARANSEKMVNDATVKVNELKNDITILEKQKKALTQELKDLKSECLAEAANIYVEDKVTSEEFKDRLSMLRIKQNELIKNDGALKITSDKAKKIVSNNAKQILRCFNSEASAITASVTVSNIDSMRNKLQKAYETLNKIFETDGVAISEEFLKMKLEELQLLYSYEFRREQEREEQKAIREQMLEEEKVRREIEREKAKLDKEETQFKNEITKLMSYMQKADSIEKQLYVDKIKELEDKLKQIEKDKENVLEREQNTRAGFVYVISNIGSFGEDVFKIGMTRRLEPLDRVKELSDASVPFDFDVHAMIFSEDAPGLESVLHSTFRKYEINKVNPRKEFFRVPLDEVEKVVKANHNATVTFTKIAEAAQYRESLRLSSLSA